MTDATYVLGKERVYDCACGATPHRPLQAADTIDRPFPKLCDHCGRDLAERSFVVEDMALWIRDYIAAGAGGE